jgi:23S rRNA pseudouridine955/2504/2580 synthase
MSGEIETVLVTEDEAGSRLDRWFKRRYPALGHGRLERLLRTGQIRVDGRRAKAGVRLEPGQSVRVPPLGPLDEASAAPRAPRPVSEEDRRFVQSLVLFRDDDVLALNKPPGLPVQGGTGAERHLDAMLDALRLDAGERPRLVHRLDRDTSGVLLLGLTAPATRRLADAFREKTTRKIYWAITVGVPKPFQGRIDLPIAKLPGRAGAQGAPSFATRSGAAHGAARERMAPDEEEGKRAITYYRVLDHLGRKAAWVALWPFTGRTHQLRVHMAAVGAPILGDGKYGGKGAFLTGEGISKKLHLHARAITLPHPRTGRPLSVEAPLPRHMRESWRAFGFDADVSEDPFDELEI